MAELNLIPYELKEVRQKQKKNIKYMVTAVVVLVLLFAAIALPQIRLYALQKEEISLKAQIDKGKTALDENKKLTLEIESINQYIKKSEVLSKEKVVVNTKIRGLEKYIPKDIVIQTLGYNNGSINLTGVSKSYNSISEFAANLQMSKEYKKSSIGNVNYNQQSSQYSFSISIEQVEVNKDEKSK